MKVCVDDVDLDAELDKKLGFLHSVLVFVLQLWEDVQKSASIPPKPGKTIAYFMRRRDLVHVKILHSATLPQAMVPFRSAKTTYEPMPDITTHLLLVHASAMYQFVLGSFHHFR